MNSFYKQAGVRIMQLRNKRGYSREALSEAAFISGKFLYEIETGRKGFSAHVACNIAKALDADIRYILLGTQIKSTFSSIEEIIKTFSKKQSEDVLSILKSIQTLTGSYMV